MRLNALWWWIDRWRKSTAYTDMTLEEQGAYRNLLDESNLRGGALPNDERILAKACGDATKWKRVRGAVMARFVLGPDGWRNETLDAVIKESTRRAEKQQRYRNALGNGSGNAAGNGGGNRRGSPDPDPDREHKIKSTAAARRPVEISEGKFSLYTVIAAEARDVSIRQDDDDSIGNIAAIFKSLCGARKLSYDSELAARAIEAVMVAETRRVS